MSVASPVLPAAARTVRTVLAAGLAAACFATGTAGAGQTSTSFEVRVNFTPAPCTTGVGPAAAPTLNCGGSNIPEPPPPPTTGGGNQVPTPTPQPPPAAAAAPGSSVWGAMIRDAARTDTQEFLFGEYSSRTVVAGDFEYLEMTVSW